MDEREKSLRIWNPWWDSSWTPKKTVIRTQTKHIVDVLNLRHIKDIIGVRRCGKTTVLHQIVNEMINTGIDPLRIVFVNFDDITLNTSSFEQILKTIYKINPEMEYLFLDEAQEKKEWERWVRTLYDTGQFKQIFVTGSSASLLSQDIGKILTGRHVSFTMLPFSFKEYLMANNWTHFDKNYLLKNFDKLDSYLLHYLEKGAFPETIGKNELEAEIMLVNVFNDILSRDIATRHRIDYEKMSQLTKYVLTHFTKEYSYRRISNNLSINIETVEKYLNYLEDSFLIFNLNLFSYKLSTQFKQNKKFYVIDNGLRNHISFRFSQDIGKLAENVVFLKLKQQNDEIYYWKDATSEVDFIVKEKNEIEDLIQVCWDVKNKKTKQREIKGIITAAKKFKFKKGIIITHEHSEKQKVDNIAIEFVPLSIWLLTG